ncbi:MAG: Yellowstone lake phycodnavirus 2, partial [Bacteroidota bacterium]
FSVTGGNQQGTFNNGAQIAFGFDGDNEYQHFIHTRHNQLAAPNNAIDFYVNSGTTANNTVTSGSTHVMSLNAGNVGVGVTSPAQKLHVVGNARITGLSAGGNVQANASGDLIISNDVIAGDPDYIHNQFTSAQTANFWINGLANVENAYRLDNTNVIFNSGTDVYGNIRVLQNNSTTLQDGMYLNYNSTGGTGAHLRMFANGTNERMRIDASTGYVGIGNTSPASLLHVMGKTNIHQSGAGGGQNLFTGLESPTSASGRAQLVLSSAYSDVVIASSQYNNSHGSTLTFASYNPANAADYRKFVVNQGNWGTRMHYLDFGYADAGGRTNPHSNINGSDQMLTLDGLNKRVGVRTMDPSTTFDVHGQTTLTRDGATECCSGGAYTLAIAENTSSTGNRSSISFHNGGIAEGKIELVQSEYNMAGLPYNNRRFRLYDHQSPLLGLELEGNLFYGNNSSRTQTRNNNTLYGNSDGVLSGFYETDQASQANGYPAGSSSWWHLIDSRHSNPGNNYSMQIAGSFYDQRLWFRKTNGSGNTAWSELIHTGNIGSYGDHLGNHTATTTLNMNNNWLMLKPDVTPNVGNRGISWHGIDPSYAIYQEAGGWSWPYPDLMIRFHTGIKLSAEGSYGGVSIYANNGESITAQYNDAGLTMWRDINLQNNDVWNVNTLTVNTIYDQSNDLVHFDQTRVRFDVGSSQDFWIENYSGHPHFRSGEPGWGFVGRPQVGMGYFYGYNFIGTSRRDTKRDILQVSNFDGLEEFLMQDIANMKPSLYKYKHEVDEASSDNTGLYRPQYHLGFILDETPDYIQDAEFSGIDLYALSSLAMVGVKHNMEEIEKIKSGGQSTKINDFGSATIDSEYLWIEYEHDFVSQLKDGQLPVVSITAFESESSIVLVEKSTSGFRIRKTGIGSLTFDWVAFAKINAPASVTESINSNIPMQVMDGLVVPESKKTVQR